MAPRLVVVDSGPLYAAADMDDNNHGASLAALERPDYYLVIPALVVAEVTRLVGSRLGPGAEACLLASLATMEVEAPSRGDWRRIAELVEQHGDIPLGGTAASVVALAERLSTPAVITLDRVRFRAIRPRHCGSLILIP
jgi:uncharacterized protein